MTPPSVGAVRINVLECQIPQRGTRPVMHTHSVVTVISMVSSRRLSFAEADSQITLREIWTWHQDGDNLPRSLLGPTAGPGSRKLVLWVLIIPFLALIPTVSGL